MQRGPVLLISLGALALALIWFRRPASRDATYEDRPRETAKSVLPPDRAPVAAANLQESALGAKKDTEDATKFFNPELMYSDSVYKARVLRHLDIRYYENSPAKDTVECVEVRGLLAGEGVGIDGVGDAYNAVWNYRQQQRMWSNDGKSKTLTNVDRMFRGSLEERLRNKYGLTNETFFDQLFQLEPKVFFGRKDFSLPQQGEKLLD